jgi:hypothetical protein
VLRVIKNDGPRDERNSKEFQQRCVAAAKLFAKKTQQDHKQQDLFSVLTPDRKGVSLAPLRTAIRKWSPAALTLMAYPELAAILAALLVK